MQQKQAILFSFILVVIVCVVFILVSQTKAGKIAQNMFMTIAQPLQRNVYTFLLPSQETSQHLLLSLEQQIVNQSELEKENTALKDQFASSPLPSQSLLPVHIIGMPRFLPGISRPENFLIDAGENQHIRVGSVVIFRNVLIGKVTKLFSSFSVVSLTTNPSISFTVTTAKTNALGIAYGKGNGILVVENVLLSDTLKVGDVVTTKGDVDQDGNGFPPGLIVGTISSIDKTPSALFQSAGVKLTLDVTQLSQVFVIKQ